MPDVKNVKPKTMLIVGVFSSIVLLIVVSIVMFFVLNSKKSTSEKSVPTTTQPVKTVAPVKREEPYILFLNKPIKVGTFKLNYPDLNLATNQQILKARYEGGETTLCLSGLALNEFNTEVHLTCGIGDKIQTEDYFAWIYGIKPPVGTPNIMNFSKDGRWSMYD